MAQYALRIGYLPSERYKGFSHQVHDRANILTLIVKALEKARLIHSLDPVSFASRTDRGVGALAQVVSFSSSISPILTEINSYLPLDIRALAVAPVPDDFDPRREAIQRTYSYFIVIDEKFHISKAKSSFELFYGTHDFRNFAKLDREKEINTVKTIDFAKVIRHGENILQFRISSRSFLWQQIRRMVGHTINVATSGLPIESTSNLLNDLSIVQKPPTAPAEHLILESIHYDKIHFVSDDKSVQTFRNFIIKKTVNYEASLSILRLMLDNLIVRKKGE